MKNTTVLFAILLICSFSMKAQNSLSKLRLGFAVSVEDNSSSKTINFDKYTGYSVDYNQSNYRLGLNFQYLLRENLSIDTSINYANKDFTGTYYCVVCDFAVPPSAEVIDFRFMEVPLTMKYYFLPTKVRLYGEFGLNNLFSLNKEAVDNSYGLAIKMGGGIMYDIAEKLTLQAGVDYNKGVTNFYDKSDFKLKTVAYCIGIMTRL